jgi:hypothetical protein
MPEPHPPTTPGRPNSAAPPPLAGKSASIAPSPVLGEGEMAKMTEDVSVRPFKVQASDAALADLKRRVAATQWPERETVGDRSQGVPLETMQNLARYWATDYDWRKCEARLNACRSS